MFSNIPTQEQGSELILDILPSYQMYQMLFTEGCSTTVSHPVPNYTNCYSDTDSSTSSFSSSSQESSYSDYDYYVANDFSCTNRFNAHTKTDCSQKKCNISMDVKLTAHNGIGIEPCFINTETKEFYPGDKVTGYVLIENKSEDAVSFSMFHVIFEGNVTYSSPFNSKAPPIVVDNFLQSVDIVASNHEVNIGNLPEFDEYDMTKLQFEKNGELIPGIVYKRFFSFIVPQSVVEQQYDDLDGHRKLPPSTQFATDEFAYNSIKYSLKFKLIEKEAFKDTLKVLGELEHCIRVIPIENRSRNELTYQRAQIKYHYEKFLGKIKNYIDNVKNPVSEKTILYNPKLQKTSPSSVATNLNDETIIRFTITKKTFPKKNKVLGYLMVSTPKKIYHIKYIPSKLFRPNGVPVSALNTWKIDIPLNFKYTGLDKDKDKDVLVFPQIETARASLIIFSITNISQTRIPIEFDHDMLFNNSSQQTFDDLIKKPFAKLDQEMVEHEKIMRNDCEFQSLVQKIACLRNLKTKTFNLNIPNIKVVPLNNWGKGRDNFTRDFKIELDLSLEKKSCLAEPGYTFDEYNLIPDFQNPHMCRMYYIDLTLTLKNSIDISIKVPLSIQN